jgi:Tol biopolymer transport system component/tRNA A-37 threonylcarbamoyl transferase component Bud32
MPLDVGERIGPYQILALIGKGGMGEVYRARDTKLDRDVAIKVMPAAVARDPERIARFEREAKVLAALNHPNIASIYGLEDRAIVMEMVEGPTLDQRLQAGPLDLKETLAIALAITDALEAAHEKGVVHRDLKPANVKAPPEGTVKVLDLGLATALPGTERDSGDAANSPTLTIGGTEAGVILGTAAYMSPEQASGRRVDKRADIWSFGAVLWEMLTGKRLFDGGETMSHTLADVLRAEIDYRKLPASTPAAIREVLKRCLDRDVKTRLRDIGEVRVAIGRYLANPDVGQAVLPPASDAGRRQDRLPHWNWLAWGVAVVLLLLAAGVSYVHFHEKAPALVKLQFPPPEKGSFAETNGPFAVSPDGRRVVFKAVVDGKASLWVRDLDSLSARMLPGTENGQVPFWSPDNRNVGFFAPGKLMRVDVTGGPAITICTAEAGRGGTWNQNDVIVFAPRASGVLFRVAAAGGTPAPVTELDQSRKEDAHRQPWFLPDGRHFLYQARSANLEQTAVFIGDLESKDRKFLLTVGSNVVYADPGYLLFIRDRTLMAQPFDAGKLATSGDARPIAEQVDFFGGTQLYGFFAASQTGVLAYTSGGSGGALQITWLDRSGRPVGTVGKPADIQTPRLSPNGKTVATDRLDAASGNRDIWLLDLVRGTEQRLTFAGNNIFPVWSPDSLRIAYTRATDTKVVAKAADGTGPEEVLESVFKAPMDWTRDDRFLISATPNSVPKTGNDLWALPLSQGKPGGKPVPLRETEFSEWHGRVSPDGRWLAYESDDTKRKEVYVIGFPALNGHWQASVDGGRYPVWSRDGRELYFVGAEGKMMAVEIKPGAQFVASVPKPLFDVRLGTSNPSFDVSADGRFLIATPVEQSASVPMTVVLNWPAALKK